MSTGSETLLYFAYGSNMCLARMRERVPSARPLGPAVVLGRELRLHKKSIDGSAKADAYATGDFRSLLWGVVFEFERHEKPALDEHEFLGVGYDQRDVKVAVQWQAFALTAITYVARSEAIQPKLKPYSWYRHFLIQGACEHKLPEDHIRFLRSLECVRDPLQSRHEQNLRLARVAPDAMQLSRHAVGRGA